MKKRAPRTVLEVAIARGGFRKGMRTALFVAQWTIAQAMLGHEPTTEEVAEWWVESRATWFRRRAEFEEIFGLHDPSPIATRAIANRQAKKLGKSDVGTVMGWLGEVAVA